MSSVEVLNAFPRRPIAVRLGWRTALTAVGSTLVAAGALAGAVWFAALFGPGLLSDARVWRDGRPTSAAGVSGSCRTRLSWLPFAWCDLRASYRSEDGRPLTRPVTALTLVDFDRTTPPRIKVDPNDEGVPALSWFAEALPLRWLALLTVSGLLTFLAGVVGVGVWVLLREHRLYRALGRDPHPVEARVVGARIVANPSWAREIRFVYRAPDGSERTGTQRLSVLKGAHGVAPADWTYEEPIPLSPSGNVVLALASGRGARLVKASFAPLVLTEAERHRLEAAAA